MNSQQSAMIVYRPEVEVLDPEESGPADRLFEFGRMIAQSVVEQLAAPTLSDAEMVCEWAKAFDKWLHFVPKTGKARPKNTVSAYESAWADLRLHCRKEARFMTGIDIAAWVESLLRRPIDRTVEAGLIKNGRRQPGQKGLSPATVNQWIAGISSFFSYAERWEAQTADGRKASLVGSVWQNPAKSHAVTRPEAKEFGEDVVWLDEDQLTALRTVIRSAQTLADLERGVASDDSTIRELRDYALFFSYMLTGARNSELRVVRWRDLRKVGKTMFYAWDNKGKKGLDELPAPCWDAVLEYLQLAGRLDGMHADDYIFQPTGDSILKMRRADGSPVMRPEDWTRNRAISAQEINRLLRAYCTKAGITAAGIHVHSLRHSAKMAYSEEGTSIEDISKLLHHSSLDMTMRYHHTMSGRKNPHWMKVADRLGV
jgi:integrase